MTDAAEVVIAARGVHKHYGAVHAVDGVDLDIRRGELFGLIGHNGAGKSTLFKMMLGLIPATAGEIRIAGTGVGGRDFRAVRRSVGYLPENVVLYDNLTGLETLQFFARLKGAPAADCAPALERVGLAHAARRRVREYSKGMRQRLGFAQALLGKPQILFLDEPTTGLDPEAIREFYAILRGLRAEGVTMVLTSHILAEIQERVDRLAIMAAGKVQALGTVQGLREQMDLPLWFEVQVADADFGAVRAALGHLPVSAIEARDGRVAVQCRREAKMAVLEALAALDGKVRDIHVREPSLEDVFFGFSD
ncbi:ABC transporter ATP-binding protein [Azoarcus sp. DD4]|uniref:ABC transporter ATP-binding protein n=1 Tax=Azoarcus sp. DD4 TaxID=2027405 RepID=UPI001F0E4887|nr:ABC transporter ATP-binding protein [Azoarcus sp. DD4]